MTVKQKLVRRYQENLVLAEAQGLPWVIDHYAPRLALLMARGSGPLPAWAKLDAKKFGFNA